MKKYKILLIIITIFTLLLTLCGCEDDAETNQMGFHDKIALDGYYIKLANEVTYENKVTEGNYYVCLDKACTQIVGSMTVAYNYPSEEMREYKAVIGIVATEKMISFSKTDNSSYYTCMCFDENQALSYGEWENVTIDSEGVMTTSMGTVTYFANGVEKECHEEQYIGSVKDRYLSSVKDVIRNEDGSLVSENVTNYNEDGSVK